MAVHRARRRFSQNFLHDAHYVGRIVAAIDPRPGERIVEIGPGLGALTAPLVAATGVLEAVEIDRDLAAGLRQRFGPAALALFEGDALRIDWPDFAGRDPLPAGAPRPLRVVGNLPYHVSTPLLFALLPAAGRVRDQHFMLQKEVVERMVAAPGTAAYGRLSVMLQASYRLERLFDVPAGAFTPAPKVVSSIVRMVPLPVARVAPDEAQPFARVVAAAFGQRRKTLRNALAGVVDAQGFDLAAVDPGARAETLGVEAFVALARVAHPPAG